MNLENPDGTVHISMKVNISMRMLIFFFFFFPPCSNHLHSFFPISLILLYKSKCAHVTGISIISTLFLYTRAFFPNLNIRAYFPCQESSLNTFMLMLERTSDEVKSTTASAVVTYVFLHFFISLSRPIKYL